jgi:hypothetical protein
MDPFKKPRANKLDNNAHFGASRVTPLRPGLDAEEFPMTNQSAGFRDCPAHLLREIEALPQHLRDPMASVTPHLIEQIERAPPRLSRRTDGPVFLKRTLGVDVSHRSLEEWPIPVTILNGKATVETVYLFAYAWAAIKAAPVKIVQNRRQVPVEQHEAA